MKNTSAVIAMIMASLMAAAGCAGRPYGPTYRPPTVGRGTPPLYAGPPPVLAPVTAPAPTPITPPKTQPPSGPSANQPGDLDLGLQPTQKTSWVVAPPQTLVSWGAPVQRAPAPNGLQLAAGGGRMLDGRSIPYGPAPVQQTAGRTIVDQAPRLGTATATSGENLRYRGGRTIPDLTYFNIFVGGQQKWSTSDREWIDYSLEAALTDPHLNHVVMQYFNGQPISANFLGSYWMGGWQPTRVTPSLIKQVTRSLYQQGSFRGTPSNATAVCYFLPPGAILDDPGAELTGTGAIPTAELANSSNGLGGYHGSVRMGSETVYFAVVVYSEQRSNGTRNGIPVFPVPWKSTAAIAYHQLQEVRTDPDADEALANRQESLLGWTSDRGQEIGDFPIEQAASLSQVFREVPLADGSGLIPVQFLYSNAIQGPEGPLPQPRAGAPLPPAQRRTPRPGAPVTPPNPNAGLDWIEKEWARLPEAVKLQILKLIEASTSSPAPR